MRLIKYLKERKIWKSLEEEGDPEGQVYILGYDKTAVDKEAVRLTFNNIYKGTLVPTFFICDDLKIHRQVNGFECQYKGTKEYCVTLCSNCVEVLSLIHKAVR